VQSRYRGGSDIAHKNSSSTSDQNDIQSPPKAALIRKNDESERKAPKKEKLEGLTTQFESESQSRSQIRRGGDYGDSMRDLAAPSSNNVGSSFPPSTKIAKDMEHSRNLEHQLDVAQQDNRNLHAKLVDLRQQELVYQEMIVGLNRQLSAQAQEHEEELSLLRTELVKKERETEDLREASAREASNWVASENWKHDVEWSKRLEAQSKNMLKEREVILEMLHNAQRQAAQNEEKALSYQKQLLSLKQDVSASTQTINQVTDCEVVEHMSQLYHESRDWVVKYFRKSRMSKLTNSEQDHGTILTV
jgi:hypothetical protein